MEQVDVQRLAQVYRDLHAHPELGFQEIRTAGVVADRLRSLGYETTSGVGRTGVVGLLRNGADGTALLRADMDALPLLEQTGLPYASTARGVDADGHDEPVMHACGHDMHVTCLLGAAEVLAKDRASWSGMLLVVFQPAEELGAGAEAMVDDGLFERFPRPDVVLGQHVAPFPAGMLALRSGVAFAASDSLRVRLFGRGGHGSRPEASVDPIVLAAATILRLQTIVSREIAGVEAAVVTVGAVHAGTAGNVIPDTAELLLSIRTFDKGVRSRVLAAVERIVTAEAAASGAPRQPEIIRVHGFPRSSTTRRPAAAPARPSKSGSARATSSILVRSQGARTSVSWPRPPRRPASTGCSVARILACFRTGWTWTCSAAFRPTTRRCTRLWSSRTLPTGIGALVRAARTWLPPADVGLSDSAGG